MAYESIDKLKVYMQKKINAIVTGEQVKFNINAHQLLDEISEMERKTKAFNKILRHAKDEYKAPETKVELMIETIQCYMEDTNNG